MVSVTFDRPEFLWLLILIVVLVFTHFILLKNVKRKAMVFGNFVAIKRATGHKIITKNITILLVRSLILIMLILGIAGATVWYWGESNESDFVIALDASASMASQDYVPTRLDAAKNAAGLFVDELNTRARIGVVSFAGAPFIMKTLSDNKLEVKTAINEIKLLKSGGTDIPGAIVTASNILLNSQKGKSIIIISDGSSTEGVYIDRSVREAIRYAQDQQVIVYSVGIGSNQGPIGYLPEYYNVSAVFDEKTLKNIAEETGGEYYYVDSRQALTDAYRSINEQSTRALLSFPLYFYLVIASLALLVVEWTLMNTRFRRIPG